MEFMYLDPAYEHRVDPVNTAIRCMVTIRRRVYYAEGTNSVWHIERHHKLIRWRFVNEIDIYCLHRVFHARIESWNNHPESGERNLIPNQLFIRGALRQNCIQNPHLIL